jgi:uncharacterized membrane protein
MALAAYLSVIGKPGETAAPARAALQPTPAFETAVVAIQSRCSMCHMGEPAWAGLAAPPKGVRLDTPEEIDRHAEAIRVQSVMTHAMPPNNVTEMTPDERRAVADWLRERRG